MQVRRRRYDRTFLVPGQTLHGQDSYVVGETVGEGGYAIVYAATSSRGTPVALKEFVLGSTVADREQVRDLFSHEREVLWSLRFHPHLPDLIEAFSQDGMHYLVLEYVPGESLQEQLHREGPIQPEQAGPLSLQLTRAVAALHGHRIVHHDVKPANVKFGGTGLAILLDLGSARAAGAPGQQLQALLQGRNGHTVAAGPDTQITGTPGYMAPELREMVESDNVVSHGVLDVFALGCTMYEFITAKRLAQDDIDARNEGKIAEAVEEIRERSPELAEPIAGTLQLRSEERYSSARELLEQLEQVVPPRPAVRNDVLQFDLSAGRGGVEQPLVITNAGGGALAGRVRSQHAAISFARPDGSKAKELALEGNIHAVRVVADAAAALADAEGAAEILVQTEQGDLVVRCELIRPAVVALELVATPSRATLLVTRQTVQQVVVRVRNESAGAGTIVAETSPPALVEVVPAEADVTPFGEAQFRILPIVSSLRPGLQRVTVSFQEKSGTARASVAVSVQARRGWWRSAISRLFRLGG